MQIRSRLTLISDHFYSKTTIFLLSFLPSFLPLSPSVSFCHFPSLNQTPPPSFLSLSLSFCCCRKKIHFQQAGPAMSEIMRVTLSPAKSTSIPEPSHLAIVVRWPRPCCMLKLDCGSWLLLFVFLALSNT